MTINIERGDITTYAVDAIVNAANNSLLGGGGLDGAIHRAAGPALLAECKTLGGLPTGQAVLTGGYRLPATYVIHVVGPVWQGGQNGEAEMLYACYANALRIAGEKQLKTVAFPSVSTGVYHYPLEKAAAIALRALAVEGAKYPSLEHLIMVCFDAQTEAAYQAAKQALAAGA